MCSSDLPPPGGWSGGGAERRSSAECVFSSWRSLLRQRRTARKSAERRQCSSNILCHGRGRCQHFPARKLIRLLNLCSCFVHICRKGAWYDENGVFFDGYTYVLRNIFPGRSVIKVCEMLRRAAEEKQRRYRKMKKAAFILALVMLLGVAAGCGASHRPRRIRLPPIPPPPRYTPFPYTTLERARCGGGA